MSQSPHHTRFDAPVENAERDDALYSTSSRSVQIAVRNAAAGAAIGTVAALALSQLMRVPPLRVQPVARPAPDYAGAMARVAALQTQERTAVNSVCRTHLLTHGQKTRRAVALLHGLTNCPAQFVKFGETLHARGMNVLMPRMRYHGLARDSFDFNRLTAEEIVTLAAETSDILHGLGEETILLGFSTGGNGAAWAAEHRGDLDRVVLVAPALALAGAPYLLQRPITNLLRWMPGRSIWWDPERKFDALGPPHAFPRAGTTVVGELLRLGLLVHRHAQRQVFAARAVTVVINPNDEVVDNRRTFAVMKEWRRQGMAVEEWRFPKEWGLVHDIFDPMKIEQQTERSYPQLISWLGL